MSQEDNRNLDFKEAAILCRTSQNSPQGLSWKPKMAFINYDANVDILKYKPTGK